MDNRLSQLSHRALLGMLVLVFLITLLPRLIGNDHALSSDEPYFFEWTNQFYTAVMRGDIRGTLVGYGYPATTIFWIDSITIGIQHALQLINQGHPISWAALAEMTDPFTLQNLLIRRLPLIVLDAAVVTLIFFLLTRLVDWRLALIGSLFIALDPFYLTQARVLRSEILAVTFMLSGFLSYMVFMMVGQYPHKVPRMGHGRRVSRRYLWLAGILSGLAIATRVSSLFGLGMMGLVGMVYFFGAWHGQPWPTRVRRALGIGLRVAFPVVLIYWLLWPVMWVDPLSALKLSAGFVSGLVSDPRTTYFLGVVRGQDPIMLVYLPVLFTLKLTPVVTVGLALVTGEAIWQAMRCWRTRCQSQRDANLADGISFTCDIGASQEFLLGVAMLVYTALYLAQMTRSGHKYDHSITPAFPPADVAAAVGLWRLLWKILERIHKWSSPGVVAAGVALLIGAQAGFVLPYHPAYSGHINALFGGPPVASKIIEVQAGEEIVAHYLNSLPDAEHKVAAVRTVRRFEPIFHGETIQLSSQPDWARADYVAIGAYHLIRQIHDPQFLAYLQRQEPIYTVNLGGLDYMRVYQGPGFGQYIGGQIEGKATLLRFDIGQHPHGSGKTEVVGGEAIPLKLLWQNEGKSPDDELFVKLVDMGGNVWTQTVARPDEAFVEAAGQEDGIVESSAQLPVPPGTPPGDYFLQVGVSNPYWGTTMGYFALPPGSDRVAVVRPDRWPTADALDVEYRLNAMATDGLWLVGYNLPDGSLSLNDDNLLTLIWQARAKLPDYVLALQLRDTAGEEVTFWLGRPARSGYPTHHWQPAEIVRDPWDLPLPADVTPGTYQLTLAIFDVETGAEVNRLRLGDVTVTERRRQFEPPPMQALSKTRWDDNITLLGYNLSLVPLVGGSQIQTLLYWRGDRPVSIDYTVFVHLLGPDGSLVAQHDGVPGGGDRPISTWEPGEVVPDPHTLNFETLPPGDYRLIVGFYDPITGQRLAVVDEDGTVLGDNLVLETFHVN
jgi:hypothetical protein